MNNQADIARADKKEQTRYDRGPREPREEETERQTEKPRSPLFLLFFFFEDFRLPLDRTLDLTPFRSLFPWLWGDFSLFLCL